MAQLPLFSIERIGAAAPLALAPLSLEQQPLEGVRVLELTRILAGPVAGRALASHGGDVMLVNSPQLPNIEAIADTSRGKRSTHIDLRAADGRAAMDRLLGQAHVFIQGYRPGALQALGYGPLALARRRPGIVCVSLSAYGHRGPWAARRGYDSLLQTAMGFNHAEGEAAGDGKPRAMPMQILDEATGFLLAFATCAALWRQQRAGGSWHVQLSLAQTAQWLRGLGRVGQGLAARPPARQSYLETSASGFGELTAIRPAAQLERTPARYASPSVRPGQSPPDW